MEVSLGIAAGLGWGIALGLAVALMVALGQRRATPVPPAPLNAVREHDAEFPFGRRVA